MLLVFAVWGREGWTSRKKKYHSESGLNKRDRATGGFVGVYIYTHRVLQETMNNDRQRVRAPVPAAMRKSLRFFSDSQSSRCGALDGREALAEKKRKMTELVPLR